MEFFFVFFLLYFQIEELLFKKTGMWVIKKDIFYMKLKISVVYWFEKKLFKDLRLTIEQMMIKNVMIVVMHSKK